MLISRNLGLLKSVLSYNAKRNAAQNLTHIRCHGDIEWAYRTLPSPDKARERLADLIGTAVWSWFFWRFYHDYDQILEEFPYPDSDKWTDEELGIPPDDADV